jgi:hypothetical protein
MSKPEFNGYLYFATFQDATVIGATIAGTTNKPRAVVLISLTAEQALIYIKGAVANNLMKISESC